MKKSRIISSLDEIIDNLVLDLCILKSTEIKSFLEDFQLLNDQLVEAINQTKDIDVEDLFKISKNYQLWKLEKFKDIYANKEESFYSFDINELKEELTKFIKSLPRQKTRTQSKNRYYKEASDSWIIKTGKTFKLFFYKISIIPLKLINLIRRLFKKEPKKIVFWKYSIPYRHLSAYQIENLLLDKLNGILYQFSQKNVEQLKNALDKEQVINNKLRENIKADKDIKGTSHQYAIDLSTEIKELSKNVQTLKNQTADLITSCDAQIKSLSAICGTFEYPGIYLRYQNRKKQKDAVTKRIVSQNIGWGNTSFGLFEDWKIDQEIYSLNYFTKVQTDELIDQNHDNTSKIIATLNESDNNISLLKNQLKDKLSNEKANHAALIQHELGNLKESISVKKLDATSENLINFNLPARINKIEHNIDNALNKISEKRWLTKLVSYDSPLKATELNSFSPRELIGFEYLPEFEESCAKLKSKIVGDVENLKQEINNIEHVVAFNLSSIMDSIVKKECTIEEIPKLTQEGIERSQNKIAEIISGIESFEKNTTLELNSIVDGFNASILKLTVNEDAFNLRMIVMKAKALKRTEEVKTQVWEQGKKYYQKGLSYVRIALVRTEKIISPWKKRIGIDDTDTIIATELSDFLAEANNKINNLPIIYQRLYKIQPLNEMGLFTGRKNEINQLMHAYQSWKEGKYSPTVILGEKWSGHTTLINYFIEKNLSRKDILYENRYVNLKDESDFYEAWKTILNVKNIGSLDDIIEVIKSKHQNKVIIIENIQNYYLRTINGFDNLNLLIKLIANTYKKVFWLFSANIYAWHYLNKTIELSGYFGYQIQMNAFSDDELRELIMKKNNISGYKIVFLPSLKNAGNKKFIRLSNEEKQAYLRKQFFTELNIYAKGNISLALTYWLLSTRKITEDRIEISNFESPDFSFINKLNSEKVFIIYLLIMHDGLTLELLRQVYQKPIEQLQLVIIMLQDDGILIEKDSWYEVNPMIYRHAINMLKARNLVY